MKKRVTEKRVKGGGRRGGGGKRRTNLTDTDFNHCRNDATA